MSIEDPLLPAAAHLSGPYAVDVLRPAVEHAGGVLRGATCTTLHYRPSVALVAQFRADVEWPGGRAARETLIAASTTQGPPAGTLPVSAWHDDRELTVGVWRWPFDPELPALADAVRRSRLTGMLRQAGVVDASTEPSVSVVAYRPTERAVLRVATPHRAWYVKVVRPDSAPGLIDRHRHLHAAGLPVPVVVAADPELGWLAVDEIVGPTLRERIKSDATTWIAPQSFRALVERIAATEPGSLAPVRSRVLDAPSHASMLATVMPSETDRLERIAEAMRGLLDASQGRSRTLTHGDLHEGQLVVDDDGIVGLLDVDDVGPGDPLDDIAVLVGHLRYRASVTTGDRDRIERFADEIVEAGGARFDRSSIEEVTAAVLVGIATGPFRLQHAGWQRSVGRTLDLVDDALRRTA